MIVTDLFFNNQFFNRHEGGVIRESEREKI